MPNGYDWSTLVGKDGVELETQYRRVLEHLGKQHGLLGLVFRKAQNKIQDPAKLNRLISDLLDKERWMILSAHIKGDTCCFTTLGLRRYRSTKCGANYWPKACRLGMWTNSSTTCYPCARTMPCGSWEPSATTSWPLMFPSEGVLVQADALHANRPFFSTSPSATPTS